MDINTIWSRAFFYALTVVTEPRPEQSAATSELFHVLKTLAETHN